MAYTRGGPLTFYLVRTTCSGRTTTPVDRGERGLAESVAGSLSATDYTTRRSSTAYLILRLLRVVEDEEEEVVVVVVVSYGEVVAGVAGERVGRVQIGLPEVKRMMRW